MAPLTDAESYYSAARQLSPTIAQALLRFDALTAASVTEIRLRSDRALSLTLPNADHIVLCKGAPFIVTHSELQACFHAVCAYSVHSFHACIAEGFVPLSGGHRAGICGSAYVDDRGQLAIKNITSINIRIARTQIMNCPEQVKNVLSKSGGALLIGAPGSGKTTLLRAIIGHLSAAGQKIAAVDERGELLPVGSSGFSTPPAQNCDVLSGYPKHIAMLHALRGLAPDVIVCDEIGGMEDAAALISVANAGVRMVASVHGECRTDILRRPQIKAIVDTGAFSHYILLFGKGLPGTVREVGIL